MNLVLFTHPAYLGLRSQDRFAAMLADGFASRGHRVQVRRPMPYAWRIAPRSWAKWAAYADQYLLFPLVLWRQVRRDPPDTLYVFCDQALGPWVPYLRRRPHVVHCHDLLALRSALGEIPENPTACTGRLYQRYIRWGFRQARCFISISEQTRRDLHRLGEVNPGLSAVVYNGLNFPFSPLTRTAADAALARHGISVPPGEWLLHVGGGQWYKNTTGVVALYQSLIERHQARRRPPPALVMVGPAPDLLVRQLIQALPAGAQVCWHASVAPDALQALYSRAAALVFPSLAEGFGWPIAEALACGCPVITTDEPPMTEVGGPCAVYLPRRAAGERLDHWAWAGAQALDRVLSRTPAERAQARRAALEWSSRFDADRAIDAYLSIYREVLIRETAPSRLSQPA